MARRAQIHPGMTTPMASLEPRRRRQEQKTARGVRVWRGLHPRGRRRCGRQGGQRGRGRARHGQARPKSKEDALCTKNMVAGESVYGEKRVSVQVNQRRRDAADHFIDATRRVRRQLQAMGRAAAYLDGGFLFLSIASTAAVRSLRFLSDNNQRKLAMHCGACEGKGTYRYRLCRGSSTAEWSPLYDPLFVNPCLCPTCDGTRSGFFYLACFFLFAASGCY